MMTTAVEPIDAAGDQDTRKRSRDADNWTNARRSAIARQMNRHAVPAPAIDIDIDAYARRVLLGATIEDKLAPAPAATTGQACGPFVAPDFPGRPRQWTRGGGMAFPSSRVLGDPIARGHVLHFFANHELLAIELMALALLRFPDAPPAFRTGLAQTIAEEQTHMRLYLMRMQELGVTFGDLPLSDFFWNHLHAMPSPLVFVTQMSLTFEQANLDFSLHYRDAVARHGDARTAAVLDRVYREEIGHVKHGLVWFNRWRHESSAESSGESDWDAYRRLLPPPLTPRRARGVGYCAEARRAAGLSETFIRELAIHSGSRGRAPVVWWFNPSCDAEIARGTPGFRASAAAERVAADLAPLLLFLARATDVIVVREPPRREWLQHLAASGFQVPEFVTSLDVRAPKLGGCEPWGWSPQAHATLRPLASRIVERRDERAAWHRMLLAQPDFAATRLAPLFSKAWGAGFLRRWMHTHPESQELFGSVDSVGAFAASESEVYRQIDALFAAGQRVVLKAPLATSGRGIRRLTDSNDRTPPLDGWIRNTVRAQGGVLVEPWLDRLHDLSIQIEVRASGTTKLLGARQFLTDARWQYAGTILGRNFRALLPEARRLIDAALPVWRDLARDVGAALGDAGYRGPAGIDAMIWRTQTGALRLKPLGEVNPRWTMGRVALALENHVATGTPSAWVIAPSAAVDAAASAHAHPPEFVDTASGRRMRSGIFFTTDPLTAHAVTTALVVGAAALVSPLGLPSRQPYGIA